MNTKKVHEDDSFNLKRIVSRLLDHWKIFVFFLLGFVILGMFYFWWTSPSYNIKAQLLVSEESGNQSSSFLGSQALQGFGDILGVQTNVYNELGILQSRDLMDQVIRDLNLNIKYTEDFGVRSREIYKKSPFQVYFIPKNDSILATTSEITFSNLGSSNNFNISMSNALFDTTYTGTFNDTLQTRVGKLYFTRTGKPFEDYNYMLTLTSVDFMVNEMLKNITVSIPNAEASIILLTYTTNVPGKGEDVLNSLIKQYTKRDLTEKNRISDSTLKFVNSRVDIVSHYLDSIEASIQNFKQSNKLSDISEQAKLLVDNGSVTNQKLNELSVQIDVANSTLKYIIDDKTNIRPVPYLLNSDPTFLDLVQKYNGLLIQRDKLSLSISDANPISQNLQTQITGLRGDLVRSLQSQISALKKSSSQLIAENGLINSKILQVPVQERQYASLLREQSVKQALYLYLLQKKEETAITQASTMSSASVISLPKSDFLPYFPNRILLLVVSIFLGLFFPAAFVMLRYALHTRIDNRDDITEGTNCNILGEIGHDERGTLLSMKEESRSVLVEQFRAMRTNMAFITGNKKCPIILLTSSMSSEGKSFVAGNLAQVYAISGKKVIILELDLRKPHISKMFGMSSEKGITNFLVSGEKIDNFIQEIPEMKNLSLISSGPIPPNPSELLLMPELGLMIKDLSLKYDLIVIDSPPIGLVTDAQILAAYSDVNLYLIRERYSYKNSLEIVNDILEKQKFTNLYLVINDVRKGASYRYGYGYGGYGYGYGNYNIDKKKSKFGISNIKKLFSRK